MFQSFSHRGLITLSITLWRKQRITFLDSLCNSATGGQSKGLNFLKLSDDRDVWRGRVAKSHEFFVRLTKIG